MIVGEKDFNLKMENKRYWEEIATHHTYLFDRQDQEIATLETLTVDDFKHHFNALFFSETTSKRLDFQLTAVKHAERQAEWTGKNAELEGLTHVKPSQRHTLAAPIETFKKGQSLHSDVFKANFASY